MKINLNEVNTKTVLTKTGGFLRSFTHTINPYAGCAYGLSGCGIYCYAAESPVARLREEAWGTWVDARTNSPSKLETELMSIQERHKLRIFMSSVTDPFQPAERKLRITRGILEVFRSYPVGLLVIQTRSPLVERDYDLLSQMPFVWLSVTVETDNDLVRKELTPTCPSIPRRFAAMQKARGCGIRVQAAVSPVLPHDINRFTDLLDSASDRVVVDTFVAGDGLRGGKTARRPLPRRYKELGWGDWRDEQQARALYSSLVAVLGASRVGWSSEGFNQTALRTLG